MFGSQTVAEPPLSFGQKILGFLAIHWRGLICFFTPLVFLPMVQPPVEKYVWCAYAMLVMAVFWVSECIPLPITAFIPVVIFPLTNTLDTYEVCKCYFNDTIVMFLGSLMLAMAIEQSGLHLRIALNVIHLVGCNHYKLFFAVGFTTMAVSMWITNTAATTMFLPIIFAVLKDFEKSKFLSIYTYEESGDYFASPLTVCYFCMATYSATIGGIGTLVGTGTNLVFKGLYMDNNPHDPDYFNFVSFSMFSIPLMLSLEIVTYLMLCIQFFGMFRRNSAAAKRSYLSPESVKTAEASVVVQLRALGGITFWEVMVLVFFAIGMVGFFGRSPQMFDGWGDTLAKYYGVYKKFIADSAWVSFVLMLMFLLPAKLDFFHSLKKDLSKNELPKKRTPSLLLWDDLAKVLPWSFILLLGGGFALSTVAKATGLNVQLGIYLKKFKDLPKEVNLLIVLSVTTFITNFASNVVVANVIVPIAMQMAKECGLSPLVYCLAAGVNASFCFCLPVGTPGNLVVQAAAHVKTKDMILAGFGPTIAAISLSWFFMSFHAPIVWPHVRHHSAPTEEPPV